MRLPDADAAVMFGNDAAIGSPRSQAELALIDTVGKGPDDDVARESGW